MAQKEEISYANIQVMQMITNVCATYSTAT